MCMYASVTRFVVRFGFVCFFDTDLFGFTITGNAVCEANLLCRHDRLYRKATLRSTSELRGI